VSFEVPDSWGLEDKVAIVSGGGAAGDGIGNGRATAILPKRTVEMIQETGGEAVAHEADVTRSRDCAAMVELAMDPFGRLDFLDNTVGSGSRGSVVDGGTTLTAPERDSR
jgi:NAD(P)-dependent dehydrogenase (short-subunit alcohol dehydrogenase family)